ncbi:DUF732 domain-containing protein [Mycolicibacterium thermoresistibile]
MRLAFRSAGPLAVGLMTMFIAAPAAGASPDGDFCRAMAGAGYTGDCATIVEYATDVCEQYERGVGWEAVVESLDARTHDEALTNFVVAGAPLYFCPEHTGKV